MKLSKEQTNAIKQINGPILILAGPGAGKTTMLLERIKYLSKWIDPRHILTITFSKNQAVDMKERFDLDTGNFMTIHAFCYLIIRNYLKKNKRQVRLLEASDLYNKYDLISKIYLEINDRKINNEDLNEFFLKTSFMKNAMLSEDYLETSGVKNIRKIYQKYEKFKQTNFFIDFDDMQVLALRYINEDNNLLRSVRNKYQYIQVDEAQDTSLIQFKIIEKIGYPKNNILLVGDDDQSIYSFRAANVSYLLNFKKTYPSARILTMNENHRSKKTIVDVSSSFIRKNKFRYDKNLFTKNEDCGSLILKTFNKVYDQYKFIKNNLDTNKKNAILFRNNIQAINMMAFLLEDGVDFTYRFSEMDFFSSNIINDIFSIIRFSEDFNDSSTFRDIYYKIKSYLSKDEIDQLTYKPINQNVFDFYYGKDLSNQTFENLIQKEKEFKHIRKLGLDKKIKYIYTYMGYKEYIDHFSKKYRQEIVNKDLFIESLINFTKNLATIEDFKGKLKDLERSKNDDESNLILSTIHRSKGLEYDNVFIINLIENEFPMLIGDDLEDKLEEERRIMYVAMTRAKENLYILSFKKRSSVKLNPSIFYKEIKEIYK
ncbi:MAG: ATP-dependent helicase [Tissierellia bacterium]|nr:ATP-dependent helicase [Tissierellia bacterium]